MKAKSKQLNSKFLVWLLVAIVVVLFATIATVAIMFARGETITSEGIVKTGSIRILSDPEDVKVTVNGQPTTLENKLINTLEPGDYTVIISKTDYLPIEKKVQVKAGFVEEIPVKLFPVNLNLTLLTHTNIQQVIYDNSKEYAYYVVANSSIGDEMGIWRQRISDTSKISLFPNDLLKISNIDPEFETAIKANDYSMFVSPDDAKLILEVRKPTIKHYILDAGNLNGSSSLTSLEDRVSFPFEFQGWLGTSNKIVIKSTNIIAQLNLTNGQLQIINYSAQNDLRYTISKDKVYFFDANNNQAYTFSNDTLSPLKLENIKLIGKPVKIYSNPSNDTILIYTSDNGFSYYLDLNRSYQTQITDTPINVDSISIDGLTVVYTKATDLSKPYLFSVKELKALKKLTTANILISLKNPAAEITSVKPTFSGDNLLISTKNDGLFITDREANNQVLLLDKVSNLNLINSAVNNSNSKIYLLMSDKTASSENVINQNNLYYINLR